MQDDLPSGALGRVRPRDLSSRARGSAGLGAGWTVGHSVGCEIYLGLGRGGKRVAIARDMDWQSCIFAAWAGIKPFYQAHSLSLMT